MMLTFRYRVKSRLGLLRGQARKVNFVWNFCNNTQKTALRWGQKWLSSFDIDKLTTGSSKELKLHSGVIQAVSSQYVKSRSQKNKPYLRYRGRKSLGWVPFKGQSIKPVTGTDTTAFKFDGTVYRVFYSRLLPEGAVIKDGSNFSEDSEGHWFLNLVVEVPDRTPAATALTTTSTTTSTTVGIDLGLKDFAVLSTGEKIGAPRYFRKYEDKLGKLQRATKQKQARLLHAKIKNARKDFHHKLSTRLIREFTVIAVGNVSSSGLAKTNLAKSVYDAGWSSFRNMLRYKAITHGVQFQEVSENFTTQVCSSCGSKTGPKGVADLGIRHWVCSNCGCSHDRDINSALNIRARLGHQSPVEGIPTL